MQIFLIALAIVGNVGAPIFLISGWVRWARNPQTRDVWSILSLMGFGFGTASALLAICTFLYGHKIGGFPYYDPLLLKIYFWGCVISLAGIVFSLGGLWKKHVLRWHAPALTFCMLVFWFVSASGE